MKKTLAATAVALCAAALLPATAGAQTSDAWQFGASIYLYLPTISGKTTFPQGAGSDVAVDADKIMDSLQGAFMGNFEARKGLWGGFTDIAYFDLGQSKSGFRDMTVGGNQLPANVSGNADFNLKGSAWTLAGSYRVQTDQRSPVDVFAGARMLDIQTTLAWQLSGNVGSIPTAGRAGNLEAKLQNWDAIVGVKGRWAFGSERKWFVPYYLDVGTGESDSTFQAMAGVGYSFGWGDVIGSWRYLDYNMKSGSKIESLNFNGPSVAAVFHW
jgi:hypothetical protein